MGCCLPKSIKGKVQSPVKVKPDLSSNNSLPAVRVRRILKIQAAEETDGKPDVDPNPRVEHQHSHISSSRSQSEAPKNPDDPENPPQDYQPLDELMTNRESDSPVPKSDFNQKASEDNQSHNRKEKPLFVRLHLQSKFSSSKKHQPSAKREDYEEVLLSSKSKNHELTEGRPNPTLRAESQEPTDQVHERTETFQNSRFDLHHFSPIAAQRNLCFSEFKRPNSKAILIKKFTHLNLQAIQNQRGEEGSSSPCSSARQPQTILSASPRQKRSSVRYRPQYLHELINLVPSEAYDRKFSFDVHNQKNEPSKIASKISAGAFADEIFHSDSLATPERDYDLENQLDSCLNEAFIGRSSNHESFESQSGVSKSSHIRRTSSNRYRDEDLKHSKSVKSDMRKRVAAPKLQRKRSYTLDKAGAFPALYNAELGTTVVQKVQSVNPAKFRKLNLQGVRLEGVHTMIDGLVLLKSIGQGSWSDEVFLAYDTVRATHVAVKVLNLAKLFLKIGKQMATKTIRSEVSMLKTMNHKNIIKLYDALEDPNHNKVYIAMEYCSRGCLLSPENQNGWPALPISLDRLKKYTKQLAEAVFYLHEVAHVVHNDLKPDNILISDSDEIKVCDFGTAWGIEEERGDAVQRYDWGTKLYLPPEIWAKERARGKPLDVWSLGCIVYLMSFGSHPVKDHLFSFKTESEMAANFCSKPIEFPAKASEEYESLIDLLKQMLAFDMDARIDATGVLSHPFIACRESRKPGSGEVRGSACTLSRQVPLE